MEKTRYKVFKMEDEMYPKELIEIDNPPKTLYGIGNWDLLKNRKVAIVGSRKSTEYGKWVARELGKKLSNVGVTVVSGLAVGIDKEAHLGALDFTRKKASYNQNFQEDDFGIYGSTIAVLGSGLDINYPVANAIVRKTIEENGLVLSEYIEGTKPFHYNFPMRNRIISGLSEKIVVVEGGIKSGAILTGEIAGEQGKDVYAVPGNINSINSLGTNKLIKDGAIPLVFMEDIIMDMGINSENNKMEENLGEEEKKIIKILEKEGEIDMNTLAKLAGLEISVINGIVSVLEIKGKIFSSLGKVFLAKL